jgi:hypothetical protein
VQEDEPGEATGFGSFDGIGQTGSVLLRESTPTP